MKRRMEWDLLASISREPRDLAMARDRGYDGSEWILHFLRLERMKILLLLFIASIGLAFSINWSRLVRRVGFSLVRAERKLRTRVRVGRSRIPFFPSLSLSVLRFFFRTINKKSKGSSNWREIPRDSITYRCGWVLNKPTGNYTLRNVEQWRPVLEQSFLTSVHGLIGTSSLRRNHFPLIIRTPAANEYGVSHRTVCNSMDKYKSFLPFQ